MEIESDGTHRRIVNWRASALRLALLATFFPLNCLAGSAATPPAHAGGIDDIDAIGNRNVGCAKGAGNWYSLEKQVAWGKQISHEVESQAKLINDPIISEYVNRVGQNIVRNSDAQVPFTIKVLDSDDVNAFALPGGFSTLTPDSF